MFFLCQPVSLDTYVGSPIRQKRTCCLLQRKTLRLKGFDRTKSPSQEVENFAQSAEAAGWLHLECLAVCFYIRRRNISPQPQPGNKQHNCFQDGQDVCCYPVADCGVQGSLPIHSLWQAYELAMMFHQSQLGRGELYLARHQQARPAFLLTSKSWLKEIRQVPMTLL